MLILQTPSSRLREWSAQADHLRECLPGEILFWEGDRCESIGLVISGKLTIRSLHPEGTEFLIQTLESGHFFGDVMTFADESAYLGQVVAEEKTTVAFFSPRRFVTILKTADGLLEDYLRTVSQKTFELKQELKLRGVPTLRERILFYLRSEIVRQGRTTIELGLSRERWASRLGVSRPSLSRELSILRREGILWVCGRSIAFTK